MSEQMREPDKERERENLNKIKSIPPVILLHLGQPQLDVRECESHNKLHRGLSGCLLSMPIMRLCHYNTHCEKYINEDNVALSNFIIQTSDLILEEIRIIY